MRLKLCRHSPRSSGAVSVRSGAVSHVSRPACERPRALWPHHAPIRLPQAATWHHRTPLQSPASLRERRLFRASRGIPCTPPGHKLQGARSGGDGAALSSCGRSDVRELRPNAVRSARYPKSIAGSGTRYWENLKLWSKPTLSRADWLASKNETLKTGREYEDTYSTTQGNHHGRSLTRTR
jgi:hypothetical protein